MQTSHKFCTDCGKSSSEVLFRPRRNQCKPCYNLEMKNYFNTHPEQRIRNRILARKSVKARQTKRKQWHSELKNRPCTDCGLKFHPQAMEFDHIKDKTIGVALMVVRGYSERIISEEIEKCEIVCVLCHRIRTIKRRIGEEKYFEDLKKLCV